jgi:hypothetical protein
MITRILTIDENLRKQLDEIGEEFYQEARIPGKFNVETFLNNWQAIIRLGFGALWKFEDEGRIFGMLGGLISPDLCDGTVTANEAFWFVRKQNRGSLGGIRLLDTFERWATEVGARRIIMTHLHKSMPEKLKALFERRGYEELETNYMKLL